MKNKNITTLIFTILVLTSVSALEVYSGENLTMDLSSNLDLYNSYSIVGNLSPINVYVENLTATIVIPDDYTPSSFSIIFEGYKANAETKYVYVGGGSHTKIIYKNNTINQTVIKEVPFEKIKEIEKECVNNCTVLPVEKINSNTYVPYIIVGAILFLILIVILLIARAPKEKFELPPVNNFEHKITEELHTL